MEYLFLRRRETRSTSQRQKNLLFKAAEKHWEEEFVMKGRCKRSLKKLCAMIDTNQTYLSNVVNRYFDCNLKELVNNYRIEYAKELLNVGIYSLDEIPKRCGFASRSPFYATFKKMVGMTPLKYMIKFRQSD